MNIAHLQYEMELIRAGHKFIAGVDEAGRGPWAGPLVAASVVLDLEKIIRTNSEQYSRNNDVIIENGAERWWSKIDDSKKLTANTRSTLSDIIKSEAVTFCIVEFSPNEIDQEGIGAINRRALAKAISNLKIKPHHVLSDFYKIDKWGPKRQTNLRKGDAISLSVAAASVLAKVHRDQLMRNFAEEFPVYGFDKHKGYGTKAHQQALTQYGPCEIHRFSFRPIRKANLDKQTN